MAGEETVGSLGVVFEADLTPLRQAKAQFRQILRDMANEAKGPAVSFRFEKPSKRAVEEALSGIKGQLRAEITFSSQQIRRAFNDAKKSFDSQPLVLDKLRISSAGLKSVSKDIQDHLNKSDFTIRVRTVVDGGMRGGGGQGPATPTSVASAMGYASTPGVIQQIQELRQAIRNSGNPNITAMWNPRSTAGNYARDLEKSIQDATYQAHVLRQDILNRAARGAAFATHNPNVNRPAGPARNLSNYGQMMDDYIQRRDDHAAVFRNNLLRRNQNVQSGFAVLSSAHSPQQQQANQAMQSLQSSFNNVLQTTVGFGQNFNRNWDRMVQRLEGEARRHFFAGLTLSSTFTLPAVAGAVGVGKLGAEYETSLKKSVAIAGVDAKAIPGISDKLIGLSREMPTTAKELADAYYFIASNGFKAADAMKVLDPTARAAAGGLGEAQVVADSITSALVAYGEGADKAAHYTDVLVQAVKMGKGEASGFAPAISKVVGMAKQMGVSFEQVMANIATVTRVGLTPSEGANALNMLLENLGDESKEAARVFAELGTSGDEVRKSLRERGLLETMKMLHDISGGNIEAISRLIGSVRGLRNVLLSAGEQMGSYREILHGTENASGATAHAFKTMSESAEFQFGRLLNAAKAVFLEVSGRLLPSATGSMNDLADQVPSIVSRIVSAWEKLPRPIQEILKFIAMLAIAAGPLMQVKGVFLNLAASLLEVGTGIGKFRAGLLGLGAAVGIVYGLSGGFSEMTTGIDNAKTGIEAMLNPLGAMLTLLTAISTVKMGSSVYMAGRAALANGIGTAGRVRNLYQSGKDAFAAGGLMALGSAPLSLPTGSATPLNRNALATGVSGPALAAGAAAGAGRFGTIGATGPMAGLATAGVMLAATAWENYKTRVDEAEVANHNIAMSLAGVSKELERMAQVALPVNVTGEAVGSNNAQTIQSALLAQFTAAQGDGDKLNSFTGRIRRVIDQINSGQIKLNIDKGSTRLFIESLESIYQKASLAKQELFDEEQKQKRTWIEDLGDTVEETYPWLGKFKTGLDSINEWNPFNVINSWNRLRDAMGEAQSSMESYSQMQMDGSAKMQLGKKPAGPAKPIEIAGPPTLMQSIMTGYSYDKYYAGVKNSEGGLAGQLVKMKQLYKELNNIVASGKANAAQKEFFRDLKEGIRSVETARKKKAELATSPKDYDPRDGQNRAADRALQDREKDMNSYQSALEGVVGKIRAFGEETEEARVRNEMMKLSTDAVTQSLKNQAIAVAQLLDKMQRATAIRDMVRGVFDNSSARMMAMGVLERPNGTAIQRAAKYFNYAQFMTTQRGRANATATGAYNTNAANLEENQIERDNLRGSGEVAGASGLGYKVAQAAMNRRDYSDFKGYCQRLLKETVRNVTTVYDKYLVGAGSAAIAARRFKKAGIGMPYQEGMAIPAGSLAYNFTSAGGDGHAMIVGADGKYYDQYGANRKPKVKPQWIVPMPGNITTSPQWANQARTAPALSQTENTVMQSLLSLPPNFDGSLATNVPDWMKGAWGKGVKSSDANATTRFDMQNQLFSRQGVELFRKHYGERGTEAGKAFIKALRVAANEDDSFLKSLVNNDKLEKEMNEARKRIYMAFNSENPFAELDYQRKTGQMGSQEYSRRKGALHSELMGNLAIAKKGDLRDFNARAGVANMQEYLLGKGIYNPTQMGIEAQMMEYEAQLIAPNGRIGQMRGLKDPKAEATLKGMMGRQRGLLMKQTSNQANEGYLATMRSLEDANKIMEYENTLRESGLLTEEEITDSVAARLVYMQELRRLEEAGVKDAKTKADAAEKEALANERSKRSNAERSILEQQRRSNTNEINGARRLAAMDYDPSNPNFYRDQQQINLETQAANNSALTSDDARSSWVAEEMQKFDALTKSTSLMDFKKSVFDLAQGMLALGDNTGIAAQAIALLNSQSAAFDPKGAEDNISGIISSYGAGAVNELETQARMAYARSEGERAAIAAQMSNDAFSRNPQLAPFAGQMAEENARVVAATKKSESAQAGAGLLENMRQQNLELRKQSEMAYALNDAERERIALKYEMLALQERGIELSQQDADALKQMQRENEALIKHQHRAQMAQEALNKGLDEGLNKIMESGLSFKSLKDAIGSVATSILDMFKQLALEQVKEMIMNALPKPFEKDAAAPKSEGGSFTSTMMGAVGQLLGVGAPGMLGGAVAGAQQNVAMSAMMAQVSTTGVINVSGSVVNVAGGMGMGGGLAPSTGMSSGQMLTKLGLSLLPGRPSF